MTKKNNIKSKRKDNLKKITTKEIVECMQHDAYKKVKGRIKQTRWGK
ncbi:MAG: hypothetical protein ACFFDF_08615 [Candidatus Odinarchaeota archaeon]